MIEGGTQVQISGEELTLLPSGGVFWRGQSALLVADLHLGKAAAFRSLSVPVPAGSSDATLSRLSRDLEETAATSLYILGDLWHAKAGRTAEVERCFEDWRARHSNLEVTLVEGNHDLKSGRMLDKWSVREVSELEMGPFLLKHHPEGDPRGFVLAGHIHPAVRLVGRGRQAERLPCFWFREKVGVLPAYGDFTGAATVYPTPGDRVFVLAGPEVVEVGLSLPSMA